MSEPHILKREIWIPKPLDEIFAFFSNAENLELLTPPWLRFEIVTPRPIPLAAGTKLIYQIRWHGIPLRWTTGITRWEPPNVFEDVQLDGPYRMWHHTHRFEAEREGTRITDIVRYQLPLGWLGRAAHALTVRRNLEQIFDYRSSRMMALFGA